MRELAAAMTASFTPLPSARSVSICTMRITAFFAIMPTNARIPRMATKPRGRPDTRSAPTTPISPSGSTQKTIATRRKLTSISIMAASIRTIISGTTANTDA